MVKYHTERVYTEIVWRKSMMSNEFEKALDAFLEGAEADEAHQALYDIIRAAFLAGWRSAGGDPPQEHKLFELIPGGKPLKPSE